MNDVPLPITTEATSLNVRPEIVDIGKLSYAPTTTLANVVVIEDTVPEILAWLAYWGEGATGGLDRF